jgi:hypothetical protein
MDQWFRSPEYGSLVLFVNFPSLTVNISAGWLDLITYYIKAYKTGTYPSVKNDRIFMWGRLYPAGATAPDPVPIPNNWQWVSQTQDFFVFCVTEALFIPDAGLSMGGRSSEGIGSSHADLW